MNLFKKKPTIDSISIPDLGWSKRGFNNQVREWNNNQTPTILSLNFFDLQPDLPTIQDVNLLREMYRSQVSQYNGGLIEVDIIEIKGFLVVKTILKIKANSEGITYLSSLTIPFKNCSYVIKLQASEYGVTGIRDATIANTLLSENKIAIGEGGYEDWFEDPYEVNFSEGLLMNKSEKVQYDSEYPNHPLSQSRKLLERIGNEIEFGEALVKAKKFIK